MTVVFGLLVFINLVFSFYLVYRVISKPFAGRFSWLLGIPRKKSVLATNLIYLFILVVISLYSLIYLDLILTGVITSVSCFIMVVISKLVIDNSPYYIYRPTRTNERLSSFLTLALFFSVFIMLIFIGSIFE